MLQKTEYSVDKDILDICAGYAHDGKLVLNKQTGNFFYDPWELLAEYKNTAIETALSALPFPIGEARLVKLEPGKCYFAHSDIDDRYHLNLSGTNCTLHDFDTNTSYPLIQDGLWYLMDAGKIHTAINAGEYPRVQLLVRKLLPLTKLKNPVNMYIRATGVNARYRFDNTLSPWLNRAVKQGIVSDFETNSASVYFDVEKEYIKECISHIPEQFNYGYQ
jgi:hypothetical protein